MSSPESDQVILRACDRLLTGIEGDPRFAHTSHLHLRHRGHVLFDRHLRGPAASNVFSVIKSVVATTLAIMDVRGLLPGLNTPISDLLPVLVGTPAERHTWRHVLTMPRGSQVDGAWDGDAVAALSGDHVAHVAQAPQLHPAGERFVYDNAGVELLSAAAASILDEPLAAFAQRELFGPLNIESASWPADAKRHHESLRGTDHQRDRPRQDRAALAGRRHGAGPTPAQQPLLR